MVDTDPHGSKKQLTDAHTNPEYDSNENGEIDTTELEADTDNDGLIEHSEVTAPAESHHNQVDDEAGTFGQGATTESETTVQFGQSYAAGVGTAGFDGAVSPVADADAAIRSYTTDANGDIDGMVIRAHNTTGAQETVRWRFAGRPV